MRALEDMVRRGNPCAAQLLRVLSGPGQTFLKVVEEVLRKPPNQDVVNTLLDTLAHYFAAVRPALADAELPALINDAQILCSACPPQDVELPEGLREVREGVPALRDALRAMVCLSRVGYAVVRPIFSRTTAIGTLMHRKLAPVTGPLLEQLAILRQERA